METMSGKDGFQHYLLNSFSCRLIFSPTAAFRGGSPPFYKTRLPLSTCPFFFTHLDLEHFDLGGFEQPSHSLYNFPFVPSCSFSLRESCDVPPLSHPFWFFFPQSTRHTMETLFPLPLLSFLENSLRGFYFEAFRVRFFPLLFRFRRCNVWSFLFPHNRGSVLRTSSYRRPTPLDPQNLDTQPLLEMVTRGGTLPLPSSPKISKRQGSASPQTLSNQVSLFHPEPHFPPVRGITDPGF